jgi:hypothetical protein
MDSLLFAETILNKILTMVPYFFFEVAQGIPLESSCMMGRVFGSVRNAYRRGNSNGGHRVAQRYLSYTLGSFRLCLAMVILL